MYTSISATWKLGPQATESETLMYKGPKLVSYKLDFTSFGLLTGFTDRRVTIRTFLKNF